MIDVNKKAEISRRLGKNSERLEATIKVKNAAKRRKGKAPRAQFKEAEEKICDIQKEIQADEKILKAWTTTENNICELN